jgi:hypothetical protein
MKYNLDDLHWQEFEVLTFKILQILISKNVQLLDGGNDKGRDIVYEGVSNNSDYSFSGRWIFQVKHKSKPITGTELSTFLIKDLKNELKKIFITNGLEYENYILVTNKSINGTLFDKLQTTFLEFKESNNIGCKNFTIISYRHLESCIENSEILKWTYPNIINHPDFKLLLKDAINYNLDNRKRGWLNGIEKQREKFVYTHFFQKAYDKLCEFPAIILSGPPKSGKTFNAEILALDFSVFKNYQPILIDNPEEIENSYVAERDQIFICDDAFGKYSLSYRIEDWFIKIERILNLADRQHLFIFTSKEYVFRAFINHGNENAKTFLEKILVESHNYPSQEKLAILKRYTSLSKMAAFDKESILNSELIIANHKNFSPETIRAFFSSIQRSPKESQLELLLAHLDKPDSYLSTVFYKLSNIKQAALISVLCTVNNSESCIYKAFDFICKDLKLNSLLNSDIEFDELDDSVLKIQRTNKIEGINFYHPSMQEFLIRELVTGKSKKLKEVVLKNLNNDLIALSIMTSSAKSHLNFSYKDKIKLEKNDSKKIIIGLNRLTDNTEVSLYQIASIFNWLKSPYHTLDLKLVDGAYYEIAKKIILGLTERVCTADFYYAHKNERCEAWSELLYELKNSLNIYNIELNTFTISYMEKLLKEKANDEHYWMTVFRSLSFTTDALIKNLLGRDWLNGFYIELKKEIYALGYEIFGDDFPLFERYQAIVKQKIAVEKLKVKPNRKWYPRFLNVSEKMDILKESKGRTISNQILERLAQPYEELNKQSHFAKNRHGFNLKQGWWKGSEDGPG